MVPGEQGVLEIPPTPHATLALFAYADVKPTTVDCLLRDLTRWPNLVYYRVSNDALISRSRSRAASDFLRSKRELVGDVLLMVDHDVAWQEGDLLHVAEKTLETRSIVAGIYSKREFGGGVAVRFGEAGEYTIGDDRIVEAEYTSTGFIGIHRDVLQKMSETMPFTVGNFWPFFMPIVVPHPIDENACEFLSEDWAFEARAKTLGFKVYVDLLPRLTHVGEWAYRVVDSQAAPPPDRGVTFQVHGSVEVPALKWLMRDVADYTGIPPDQIHQAITDGRQGLAGLWNTGGSFDPDKELEWYRREDVGRHYLLDLAGWHYINIGHLIAAELGDIKDKRVLDFGSGIGTMSLMLANQGNKVDCIEVNPELRKFADFRAKAILNGSRPPRFVKAPLGKYDMAILWHVLEHIADPVATLRQVVGALKPGGLLFSDSDFTVDEVHPMHRTWEGDWEDEMAKAGLKAIRPYWYEKEKAGVA